MQPAVGKNNGLQSAREQLLGYPGGFIDIAAADAEIAVDHRRIVENEKLFRRRRPILLDHLDFAFDELRRPARPDWRSSPSSRRMRGSEP